MNNKKMGIFFITTLTAIFIWSMINPHDYFTWVLEVAPAIIGAIILGLTYKRFQFTKLVYILLWFHAIILIVGGKYTYALNPMFDWIKETFELNRNYYDRLGHFAQGFIPALVTRELLLRTSPLRKGKWLFFTVIAFCLAISAFYELIEWWTAVATGESAESFLGTQGDIWDAQWDMFLALCGAILSQLLFGKLHDKLLQKKM